MNFFVRFTFKADQNFTDMKMPKGVSNKAFMFDMNFLYELLAFALQKHECQYHLFNLSTLICPSSNM